VKKGKITPYTLLLKYNITKYSLFQVEAGKKRKKLCREILFFAGKDQRVGTDFFCSYGKKK
jgi:hypothetical protein